MNAFKSSLFLASLLLVSFSSARAQLNPQAHYSVGEVRVHSSVPVPCYVETVFSEDFTRATVRAVAALEHLNSQGQVTWAAVGPYTGQFFNSRSLYRYQDPTPDALIKDIVLNVDANFSPQKLSLLYWHAEGAHHDPIRCDHLIQQTSPEQLQHVADIFERFGY